MPGLLTKHKKKSLITCTTPAETVPNMKISVNKIHILDVPEMYPCWCELLWLVQGIALSNPSKVAWANEIPKCSVARNMSLLKLSILSKSA